VIFAAGIRQVRGCIVRGLAALPRLGRWNPADDFVGRVRVRIADDANRDGRVVSLARGRLREHHLNRKQEEHGEDQFLIRHVTSHA
jgi:hypothetical protein